MYFTSALRAAGDFLQLQVLKKLISSFMVTCSFFVCGVNFFPLVFQSQQKFQATIKKTAPLKLRSKFVCAHMLVQSARDALFSQKS